MTPLSSRPLGLVLVAGGLALGTACDLDESFLFPEPFDNVDSIVDLGTLAPYNLDDAIDTSGGPAIGGGIDLDVVAEQVIYGEVGPTGSSRVGGLSFNFTGTGTSVCVFVDPEAVYWNQSVSASGADPQYRFPDNLFDDGDIDVDGGLSVYYDGTPGEELGTFEARYQDALGQEIPIDLIECIGPDSSVLGASAAFNGHAGRATPEFCTIRNTRPDINYTIVLEAYSLPLDDDRLGYGMLFVEGECASSIVRLLGGGGGPGAGGGTNEDRTGERDLECVILGEAINPYEADRLGQGERSLEAGLPPSTWLGASEAPTWWGVQEFEDTYCNGELGSLANYCRREAQQVSRLGRDIGAGLGDDIGTCAWQRDLRGQTPQSLDQEGRVFQAQTYEAEGLIDDLAPYYKCFCGDRSKTPEAGSL